jgi:hypothetical protein
LFAFIMIDLELIKISKFASAKTKPDQGVCKSQQTPILTSRRVSPYLAQADESNTVTTLFAHHTHTNGVETQRLWRWIMAERHGTRRRYNEGCHCEDCTGANTAYQQRYRQRHTAVVPLSVPVTSPSSGPVEVGVEAEIAGLAESRPGLAQIALALARIMDNPKAVNQQPAAAKVLAVMLDKLRSASAYGRRRGLALVRTMTEKGGA